MIELIVKMILQAGVDFFSGDLLMRLFRKSDEKGESQEK